MKLKAQIAEMMAEASRRRRDYYKAENDEAMFYFQGIELALSWVQESRDKDSNWPLTMFDMVWNKEKAPE